MIKKGKKLEKSYHFSEDEEIINLFNKIKPLLDEGKSYKQAIRIVKKSNSNYSSRWWFKRLLKYGEKQGYYNNINYMNKYGLIHVQLHKHSSSITGYYWMYIYINNGKRKTIADKDLVNLRKRVEEKGLEWRVVNIHQAKKSYDLNKKLQYNKRIEKNKGRENIVGVKYVFKHNNSKSKRGFYWVYRPYPPESHKSINAISLIELKEKVINNGLKWIIIDENKYIHHLKQDENELKELNIEY